MSYIEVLKVCSLAATVAPSTGIALQSYNKVKN